MIIDDLKGVYETAVIVTDTPDFGETVSAIIVLQKGSKLDEAL